MQPGNDATKPRKALASSRRARRPSLSTEQFLDQAFQLFVEEGYEGTSVDMIAARVGIAKRTFYQKYGDKETLFRDALKQAIRAWIVPVAELQTLESDALDTTLHAIGQRLVANILSEAGLRLMRLTNAVSGRMPEIGALNVKLGTEPTIEYIAGLLVRHLGIAFTDAIESAEIFVYMVVGGPASSAAWGVIIEPEQIRRRTFASVRTFLHGILQQYSVGEVLSRQVLLDQITELREILCETADLLGERRDRIGRLLSYKDRAS